MNPKSPPLAGNTDLVRKRRWWKYVLAGCGAALLVIIGVAALLFGLLISSSPMPISKAIVTTEDREALAGKWFLFQPDINDGKPASPLSISIHEFNVFFTMLPLYKDHVFFSRVGDKIQGEAAMPLDQWLPWIGKGRYLNGSDVFEVCLGKDGLLDLRIESATVNGKRIPRWFLRLMERKEFYRDIFDSMGGVEFSHNLQSIEIRDGCLVLTPKEAK